MLLCSFLMTLSAVGAGAELKSKDALTSIFSGGKIQYVVKSGYHFNPDAPNRIVWSNQRESRPAQFGPSALEFVRPESTLDKTGKASLYVCDDAKTFCEIHRIDLAALKTEVSVTGILPASVLKATPPAETDTSGFLRDRFTSAKAAAKASKKIMLVDFQARWCPGCRRMETEIFSNPAFKKTTSDWIKVSVDVDRYENFDLISQYSVSSIPDLIILDSDGNEISRIIDYQPLERILSWVKDASLPSDLRRRGLNLFYAQKYAEAIEVFGKLTSAPAELIQAEIELAKERHDEASVIQTLEKALQAEPDTYRSFNWRLELLGLQKKKNPDFRALEDPRLNEARQLLEAWLKDESKLKKSMRMESVGEFSGLEKFYAATTWAEGLKDLGATGPALQTAWDNAIELGKKNALVTRRPGPALRYLLILTEADQYKEADHWVRKMIERDPTNHDLLRRHLKILVERKDFTQGIAVGLQALRFAEGRMEFSVVENLAKSYLGNHDKKSAIEILNKYLKRDELKLEKMKKFRENLTLLRSQADH